MLFLNQTHPYMRVYNPVTGDVARFVSGRLELEPSDPNYEFVLAEAQKNPYITIVASEVQCVDCGEKFEGAKAKAHLKEHRKDAHFDRWIADLEEEQAKVIETEVKARAGYPCDICQPVQEFPDKEGLANHVRLIHTPPPPLSEGGETIGGNEGEGPAPVDTSIPAAKRTK